MTRERVAAGFASALAIAVAWRAWLSGRHSPFEADIEFYHHPVTRELVAAFREGRIPLWTDRVYCGFPFFADTQTAAWYPGTWLVVALGPHAGYVLFLLLHAWLAAVGCAWLLRAHGCDRLSAFAAGLVVPLGGFFVYETQHPNLFAILCWVPLWLVATRAVFLRPGAGRIVWAAVPPAMMVLAGTLQVLFGALLLYGFYLVALWVESQHAGVDAVAGDAPHGRRGVGLAAVAGSQLLSLLVTAIVWWPGLVHFPLTARALGMDYAFGSMGSVHPVELLGHAVHGAVTGLGAGQDLGFAGAPLYLGALTLPLAVLGALRRPRALSLALSSAAAVLLLLALGRHGVLHPFLYEHLPGAGALRGVGRALGPAAVAIAVLVGLGLARLGEPGGKMAWRLALVSGLVLEAWVGFRAASTVAVPLVGAVVLVSALGLSWLPPSAVRFQRPTVAALLVLELAFFGASHELLRADPPPPGERQQAGSLRFPSFAEIAAGEFGEDASAGDRVLLLGFGTSNFTFHHGLDGVGGYNPLVTLPYLDLVGRVNAGRSWPRVPLTGFVHHAIPGRTESALFDATSARYLVSGAPLEREGLELLRRYGPHPLTGRPVLLYGNTRALPRAYLAHRTRVVEGREAVDRALAEGFDPRVATVVEGDAPALSGPAGIAPLSVTRESPEWLRLEVETEHPGVVVVADSWYPGWQARVGDAPAPLLRVNGSFRGVAVPAGRHQVELRFAPASFRQGAVASGLGLLVTVALLARSRAAAFSGARLGIW